MQAQCPPPMVYFEDVGFRHQETTRPPQQIINSKFGFGFTLHKNRTSVYVGDVIDGCMWDQFMLAYNISLSLS